MGPIEAVSHILGALTRVIIKSCDEIEKTMDAVDHLVTVAERNCYALRVEEEIKSEARLSKLKEKPIPLDLITID